MTLPPIPALHWVPVFRVRAIPSRSVSRVVTPRALRRVLWFARFQLFVRLLARIRRRPISTTTTPGSVLMGGGTDVDAAFQWMSSAVAVEIFL